MKRFFSLLAYLIPYWERVFFNVLFNILSVIFGLFSVAVAIPFLSIIFNNQPILSEAPEFSMNVEAIMRYFQHYLSELTLHKGAHYALMAVGIIIIIMSLFKNLFRYLAMYNLAPIRNGIPRDIRNKLFKKVLLLPLAFYSNERKGDIMSRMNNDVQEVEWSLVSSIEMLIRDPITILIYLATLIYMSPSLTIFVIILLPLGATLIGMIGKNLRKTSFKGQKQIGLLTSVIEETLGGLRIIKAFNAEKSVDEKFKKVNHIYAKLMIKLFRRNYLANPVSEFLGTMLMVVIMWYGGTLVLGETSSLTTEQLIAYLLVFYLIIAPAKSFSSAYYNIQKGIASVDRINAILQATDCIPDKNDAKTIANFEHEISYHDVSFKYVDTDVLKNIQLTIPKGKTIALVGQSGSGKSTLADLLPRFYDVTQGKICIDDTDIRDISLQSLRSLMGIVTQEAILFNDTFYNNIAFGSEYVNEEQVIEAAKIANAHDFIMEFPDAYQTNVGDRGGNMSGGQRQRISIARAILKNPPIMILDEATSALDTESEKIVQEALMRLMKNRTVIIIAHRLSTIVQADMICVLHEGNIVERGTHEELLNHDGYYKKLYHLQTFSS
jgi:subfamily B ATP-binding cassette protein MsbA